MAYFLCYWWWWNLGFEWFTKGTSRMARLEKKESKNGGWRRGEASNFFFREREKRRWALLWIFFPFILILLRWCSEINFVVKICSHFFFFLPWWSILNHVNWFCEMLIRLSCILNSYRINFFFWETILKMFIVQLKFYYRQNINSVTWSLLSFYIPLSYL